MSEYKVAPSDSAEEEYMLEDSDTSASRDETELRAKWQEWESFPINNTFDRLSSLRWPRIGFVSGIIFLTFFIAWFGRGYFDASYTALELHPPERCAIVTFVNPWFGSASDEDVYYTNARMLAYQTLHAPSTKVSSNIDFVVATVPGVERSKWDRLAKDGAVLKEVAIDAEIAPTDARWKYMMSKLELLKFLEYDKILFLDADTLLMESMEDIFQDPGAKVTKTINMTMTDLMDAEPELPKDYLWASVDDLMGHGFEKRDMWTRFRYFNGGFWMARPSLDMYDYLVGLMPLAEGRFNAQWNEQNLFNYAFRRGGPMPWTELNWQWNIWGPQDADWKQNLKSYHGHLWDYGGYKTEAWAKIRKEMEEFHAEREGTEVPELTEIGLLKSYMHG